MMPNSALTLSFSQLSASQKTKSLSFSPPSLNLIKPPFLHSNYFALLPKKGEEIGYLRFSTNQLPTMLIITAITMAMIIPISVLIAPSTAVGPSSPCGPCSPCGPVSP